MCLETENKIFIYLHSFSRYLHYNVKKPKSQKNQIFFLEEDQILRFYRDEKKIFSHLTTKQAKN